MDVQADLLSARGDVIIEGAFLKNRWLCEIFAALRRSQPVYLSADETGTVQGCGQLAHWSNRGFDSRFEQTLQRCSPANLPSLQAYKQRCRALVDV